LGPGAGQSAIPGKRGISISGAAHERLSRLVEERATPGAGMRIAVKGGGCSGLSYSLNWDEKPREKDRVFERGGVRVFVDPKSYIYLVGTVVEYETSLLKSGFKLVNPQQKTSCGCGESFAV
jgi:iron-sulfur cluster assembly protein